MTQIPLGGGDRKAWTPPPGRSPTPFAGQAVVTNAAPVT